MSEFKFETRERRFQNEGFLIGRLEGPVNSICLDGEDLLSTKICVPRTSGNVDMIPVLFTNELYSMANAQSKSGDVQIDGFFRSYTPVGRTEPTKHFFQVQEVQPRIKNFVRNNSIHLCGNVCVAPRLVGKGSLQLTYFNMVVCTPNKNNIFSCYARAAYREAASSLKVGDYIEIYGRMQSIKPSNRKKALYPVCVSKFEVIGYKGTHVDYTPKFTQIKYREQ